MRVGKKSVLKGLSAESGLSQVQCLQVLEALARMMVRECSSDIYRGWQTNPNRKGSLNLAFLGIFSMVRAARFEPLKKFWGGKFDEGALPENEFTIFFTPSVEILDKLKNEFYLRQTLGRNYK